MSQCICEISGSKFFTSEAEDLLRTKLNAPLPRTMPIYTFRHLLAFWQSFAVHKRCSDYSGDQIISVFDEQCPYPVWHREEWIKHSDPPSADFDFTKPYFEQLWALFQRSPIPHNLGAGNENCEYTDDWWHCRNCYLCHSGLNNEDCRFCYRLLDCRDCSHCVFCFESELCFEAVNCRRCYSSNYLINCQNCSDSAFLFDCRNCTDCFLCWNLRNKRFCIENRELSEAEYRRERSGWDLRSRTVYDQLEKRLREHTAKDAWWKGVELEMCTDSWGSYLDNCKECENCHFLQHSENCINCFRGYKDKDCLDSMSFFDGELVYMSNLSQDNVYDIRYCYDVMQCSYMEYCAHCFQCKNCFACCGLVGEQYRILNKQYSAQDYNKLAAAVRAKIAQDGLNGLYFPGYFAANPYEESLSALHYPLTRLEQQQLGYRVSSVERARPVGALDPSAAPDTAALAPDDLPQKVFWDQASMRPFQITKLDLQTAEKLKAPLPDRFYARRLRELFGWMQSNGELREAVCVQTAEPLLTHLPQELNPRILSPAAYKGLIA